MNKELWLQASVIQERIKSLRQHRQEVEDTVTRAIEYEKAGVKSEDFVYTDTAPFVSVETYHKGKRSWDVIEIDALLLPGGGNIISFLGAYVTNIRLEIERLEIAFNRL